MKKTIFCLLTALLLSLCGCSTNSLNKMGSYSVAAIGFEANGTDFSIYVETVIVNSEESQKPIEKMLFKGKGDTPEKAYTKAVSNCAKPLSLGHCATLVLSEEIEEKAMSEIFDFCLEQGDITVSVAVIKTENVEKLLSLPSVSSVAVGYDIVSVLETQYRVRKISFANRLYEISVQKKSDVLKCLPEFSVKDKALSMKG